MSSTLLIDIGTHKAEELCVLSGYRFYILRTYSLWWFDWFKRQVKKVIRYQGLIKYGTGAYIKSPLNFCVKSHFGYLKQGLIPTNYLEGKEVIAIDPASEITTKYLEKISSLVNVNYLPIAILPHDIDKDSGIVKFYIEKNSLSSSMNDSGSHQKLVLSSAYSFERVIDEFLSHQVINSKTNVILRMNCEGAELAIIKSLIEKKVLISLVVGSVNDVLKKYGEKEADYMNSLLKSNNIEFEYFKGSDPSTWLAVFDLVKKLRST